MGAVTRSTQANRHRGVAHGRVSPAATQGERLVKPAAILFTAATLAAVFFASPPAGGAPPRFDHLDPGGQPSLAEKLPVNMVFIGHERDDVDPAQFRSGLAKEYEPIVRSRAFYGIPEKLGITYEYRYNIKYADRRYEDRFFRALGRMADPAPLTEFQKDYNAQTGNARVVRKNHFIDAPSVEKWLAENSPSGVDTRRNTVYLINWYGRSDFKFHVYTKTNEPDPDTGYNFGTLREDRKIVAWGGTTADDEEDGLGSTRRVWFHDLSAGPEQWAGNWNVDDADLDGDEVADYRIPVAWEYGKYRPASRLTGDLALLTRYVALDLLMTTSPLYPVELPTDNPPDEINVDSNTYEGWPGVNASREYITPRLVLDEIREVLHRKDLSYDNQDLRYAGEAKRCYEAFLEDQSCYPETGLSPFANFFLQNDRELARTKDDGDSVDYELPIFNYALDDEPVPALGFADDNYVDGTQSLVFAFVSPEIVDLGYGLTTTIIHEVGHHVGLSHPHDGYDSATGVDFEPSGEFFFAWAGDESNSMMSYIDLNWDFSQFDRDNMDRFQAAALVEAANRLAAEALSAPHPERAGDELRRADLAIGQAENAFARHDYVAANRFAERAYQLALEGAEEAGVDVEAVQRRAELRNQDVRIASEIHQPGEFIDTLDDEPRG